MIAIMWIVAVIAVLFMWHYTKKEMPETSFVTWIYALYALAICVGVTLYGCTRL